MPSQRREALLYAAATAANVGDRYTAFACLERLDQLPNPWDRCLVQPDQRARLAAIVREVGLQPLTVALLRQALRRFGDAGAQFLVEVIAPGNRSQRRSLARAAHGQVVDVGCGQPLAVPPSPASTAAGWLLLSLARPGRWRLCSNS